MILDKKMQIFLAVANSESFSKAARQLGLSPSVVSFHIDALEKHLGVSLFERHGRRIALSREGGYLSEKARILAHEAEMLEESFSQHSKSIQQCLRLAGDALTCAYTLPHSISEFRKQEPDVTFTYAHLSQDEMIQGVHDGELDVALVGHATPHKHLASQECFTDDIILATLPNTVKSPIMIGDLRQLPLLWITSDYGLELALKSALSRKGVLPSHLNIFMEVADLPILKMLMREGVGSAFLPRLAVEDELQYGIFEEAKIEGLTLRRTTQLLYRKEEPMRPVVERFLAFSAANRDATQSKKSSKQNCEMKPRKKPKNNNNDC